MSGINLKLAEELLFDEAVDGGITKASVLAYRDKRTGLKLSPAEANELFELLTKRIEFEKARRGVNVIDPVVIVDSEGHVPWHDEWLKSGVRTQWRRYADFLAADLQPRLGVNRAAEVLEDIDRSSDRILDRMENPSRDGFSTKGLVLGYVQSGKTANFTAVVGKAADAGYKLIIVLTGIHENLRWQTQQRLDCQLTGEPDNPDQPHVEQPRLEQHRWQRLTDDAHDFDTHHKSRLSISAGQYRAPILAVMKKNCRVMDKLIKWIEEAPKNVRDAIPLLVIDDEADQASIDTKYAARARDKKNIDPTATNKRIRKILSLFRRKNAYIGYTATPFANFLISAGTNSKEWGRDLYPRNFIISLNKPSGYFGTDEMFSGNRKELFFREVPIAERDLLVAKKRNEASVFPRTVTRSLENAIHSFILAGAARTARGDKDHPVTMLVHTSNRTESQSLMKRRLEKHLAGLRRGLADAYEKARIMREFERLWEKDFQATSTSFSKLPTLPFSKLEGPLRAFLKEVQVFELNFGSDDKLDYIKVPDLRVLAIGGNKLSRGLTLGGLVTSFYLRPSKQYDTLLQMGRWFGYRNGYEDLTRVYTTKELAEWFEDLALVEREIRDQIRTYEDDDLTPKELAVRIRVHSKMKVTAANKLGAAKIVQGSFSGRWTQTIWFPLNEPKKLRENLAAGEELLRASGEFSGDRRGRGFVRKGVSVDVIRKFLQDYNFASGLKGQLSGIDKGLLLQYIDRLVPQNRLCKWNVAIASQKDAPDFLQRLEPYGGLEIHPMSRNRRDSGSLRLGVLSTPDHLYMDHPAKTSGNAGARDFITWRGPNEPLLLLYYISKDSKLKPSVIKKKSNAVDLFDGIEKKVDVLGVVLVFPEFKQDPLGFIGQELDSD